MIDPEKPTDPNLRMWLDLQQGYHFLQHNKVYISEVAPEYVPQTQAEIRKFRRRHLKKQLFKGVLFILLLTLILSASLTVVPPIPHPIGWLWVGLTTLIGARFEPVVDGWADDLFGY